MAKGYWIVAIDVTDPEGYPAYIESARSAFQRHGARFLVRGGSHRVIEGNARARHVVIEFPSYAEALACYRSAEYQAAAAVRQSTAVSDIVIAEGVT